MINIALYICIIFSLVYTLGKLRTQVHMLQQNSYKNNRYLRWAKKHPSRAFRRKDLLPLLALPLIYTGYTAAALAIWLLGYGLLFLTEPRLEEKKKLVYTFRVKRLGAIIFILLAAFFAIAGFTDYPAGLLTALSVATVLPFPLVMLANMLAQPVEAAVQNYYCRQAKAKLAQMKGLTVVGLTGSYGKTSTKYILAKILSAKHNVLMTPESYNTLMGVVRTIREMLKPTHEIAVIEMGAMQRGDIKEICDLVSPVYGVLTAIGEQHLETFKNLETIKKTKFELVEAIPDNGAVFLNYDDDNVRQLPRIGQKKYIYYSLKDETADYFAYNLKVDASGTSFIVRKPDASAKEMTTKLLGRHNIGNILAGIAVASELGLDLNTIARAVRDLKPVEHRLSIVKHPNNVTVLDDAFNSNPIGAKMALEVLGAFQGNKKILVTPGMIELGEKHYSVNKAFGEQAAEVCDYVILVGQKQTAPILAGLTAKGFPRERCTVVKNLNEALNHLKTIVGEGDVVLFENDLPDTYNE